MFLPTDPSSRSQPGNLLIERAAFPLAFRFKCLDEGVFGACDGSPLPSCLRAYLC